MKMITSVGCVGAICVLVLMHDGSLKIGTTPATPTAASSGGSGAQLRPGSVPSAYVADIVSAATVCPQITAPLLAAQINQESGFDPKSLSSTNAEGIAQFEPYNELVKDGEVDPWTPQSAIHGMALLDCSGVKKYGSVALALAAYNGGPGVVSHWQSVSQTHHYVLNILAAESRYTGHDTGPAPAPTPTPTTTSPSLIQQFLNAWRSNENQQGSGS